MTRIANTALEVFRLNLGGNTFGWTSDRTTSFAVLDAYAAAGGNFLDTADSYSVWAGNPGGVSEAIIGEWMAARGNRERMVVATKVGSLPTRKGLAATNVTAALNDSLRRLRINVIDLYYLHYDDEAIPIPDQVKMGHALVRSGRVRYLGLSNFKPERMHAWFETATREKLTIPVAIQPHYNLVHRRRFEQEYAPIAREFGAAVFPYYALASGFLTGKYHTQDDLAHKARGKAAAHYLTPDGLGVITALRKVAGARSVEPATVALAWLLAKGVTAPIASARTPGQLPSLLAAVNLTLNAAETATLDAASEPFA